MISASTPPGISEAVRVPAWRWAAFCGFLAAWAAAFFTPLRDLAVMSRQSELYSHTAFMPVVSLYFLWAERRRIFQHSSLALPLGLATVAAAALVFVFGRNAPPSLTAGDRQTLMISSAWLLLLGGFLLCFGLRAFRAALFPLLFLAFMIPLPVAWVEEVVLFLRRGSAEVTGLFFRLLGVAFLREDMVFRLSRVTVEIAPQCSGIRSSLALLITGVLASHMFLRTWWGRFLFLTAVLPLAMVKNAIRIVTLTLLAQHVDEGFLTKSWLHHSGGGLFFAMALLILGAWLLLVQRLEGARGNASVQETLPFIAR